MAAIIEVLDRVVTFDGKQWASDDPDAARLCRLTAEGLPCEYYPHRVNGLARAVAKSLEGHVISLEPYDPNAEFDPDVYY